MTPSGAVMGNVREKYKFPIKEWLCTKPDEALTG